MRIVISYHNGTVNRHFNDTELFKVYKIENNQIDDSRIVSKEDHSSWQLAFLLHEWNIDTLITGSMGKEARNKLNRLKIDFFSDVEGEVDTIIQGFMNAKSIFENVVF